MLKENKNFILKKYKFFFLQNGHLTKNITTAKVKKKLKFQYFL